MKDGYRGCLQGRIHAGTGTTAACTATVCMVGLLSLAGLLTGCGNGSAHAVRPCTNQGRPWRIGYCQGGDYRDYGRTFRSMLMQLHRTGWIVAPELPPVTDSDTMAALWDHASRETSSAYLQFVSNAFWDAQWDPVLRKENRTNLVGRLQQQQDIDLLIGMGTWAGRDIADAAITTSVMLLNSSDPVKARILNPAQPVPDHQFIEHHPELYKNQLRLFHDLLHFERLGVIHEDSANGRTYANLPELKEIAREKGFTVIPVTAPDTALPEDRAAAGYREALARIAPDIDALWMSAHRGETPKYIPDMLPIIFSNRIATWSTAGDDAVRRGALISITQHDLDTTGAWYADVMARILNGDCPGRLPRTFDMPRSIILNAESARQIGLSWPKPLLETADKVYMNIER